uniref:Uncharacterized protein n=1 Tax=viral metagenome TaxID=1070528 RepID=A0A6M3JSB6_9ZZZZ
MARGRIIKPEFWDDEKLGTISLSARLTFIGLWSNSDDYGVVKGHSSWLKNRIFPYDDIKKADFEKWLAELENISVVIPFDHNGEKFYLIKHFSDHQKVDKPSKTRNPEPPDNILKDSTKISEDSTKISEDSTKISEDSEKGSDEVEVEVEVEVKRSKVEVEGEGSDSPPPDSSSRGSKVSFKDWPEYVNQEIDKLINDLEWIQKQESKYQNVDIVQTLDESRDYWSSAEGFKKKKGSGNSDWKSTFYNNFKDNWRCVPKRSDGKVPLTGREKALEKMHRMDQTRAP